jgi:ABC-type antimicrobial peptide transport system permease subunit
MILGQGLKISVLGMAVGLAASFALMRFIKSLLYGVTSTDPITFVAVALLLTLIALAACYIPARRATRVDPMKSLACE